MTQTTNWNIIHGDALKVLEGFAPDTFDAVITDPPYASGGRTQAEKNKSTTQKYSSMKNAPPPFDGDAKDQRISGAGRAGRRNGCIWPEKPASPVRQSVCSSTGGSFRRLPMPSSGQAGSGEVPPSGTRATAAPRKGASGSRQNISSGAAMGICPSPAPCPVCPECLSTAIPRSGFISRKSPSSSCGTW